MHPSQTTAAFRRLLIFCLLGIALAVGLPAQQTARSAIIGDTCLTLRIPGNWTKSVTSKDLKADQYFAGVNMGVLIFANESPLADAGAVDDFIVNLTKGFFDKQGILPLDYEPLTTANATFKRKRFNLTANNLPLSYLVASTSFEGHVVSIIAWTIDKGFDSMRSQIDQVLQGLGVDRGGEAWRRHTKMASTFLYPRLGAVELSWPASVWRHGYQDGVLQLESTDATVNLSLLELSRTPDEASFRAGIAQRIAESWPNVTAAEKGVFTGPHGERYPWTSFTEDDNGLNALVSCYIAGPDGASLELRVQGVLNLGSQKNLAQDFLSRLVIHRDPESLPFPPPNKVTGSVSVEAPELSLLRQSKLELEMDSNAFQATLNDAGQLVLLAAKGVYAVESARSKLLFPGEFDYQSSIAASDKSILSLARPESPVTVDGKPGSGPAWTAKRLWPAANVKGVLAEESLSGATAVSKLWQARDTVRKVVFHPSVGASRTIATINGTILAASMTTNQQVIVAWTDGWLRTAASNATHLTVYGPSGAPTDDTRTWKSISALVAGDQGWLIKGTRTEGTEGIWLADAKQIQLLAYGDIEPIALAKGRFWYSTRISPVSGTTEWGRTWVYSLPVGQAQQLAGQRSSPDAAMLNWLGHETGLDLAYPTLDRERLLSLAQRLEGLAQAHFGLALPRQPATIDLAIDHVAAEQDLEEGGERVLVVLLSAILTAGGCEWVPQDTEWNGSVGGSWSGLDSPFTNSWNPALMVHSALYDEEGWYHPAETISDEHREGKSDLLGLDKLSLSQREEGLQDKQLSTLLVKPDPLAIRAWLDSARHQSNLELRERVYSWLLQHENHQVLAALLKNPAPRAEERALGTLYRGLLARVPGFTGSAPTIAEYKSAIAYRPQEVTLYYLLAQAWEGSGDPAAGEKALACYRKLNELYEISASLKALAEADIERLEYQLGSAQPDTQAGGGSL